MSDTTLIRWSKCKSFLILGKDEHKKLLTNTFCKSLFIHKYSNYTQSPDHHHPNKKNDTCSSSIRIYILRHRTVCKFLYNTDDVCATMNKSVLSTLKKEIAIAYLAQIQNAFWYHFSSAHWTCVFYFFILSFHCVWVYDLYTQITFNIIIPMMLK